MEDLVKTDSGRISLTIGGGIHFMYRRANTEPFGETEVDTDYSLNIGDIHHEKLSLKHDIIV